MAKNENQKYDFGFIALALGLVPIGNGIGINPGAITDLRYDNGADGWIITLHGGRSYDLSHLQMSELEETIKRRSEEAKIIQKEALRNQMIMQQEVFTELNNRVQPGQIVGAVPMKRRQN